MLLNERARFDLARRLRASEGAALGEVFSFLSGLYFRAKLLYSLTFANAPRGVPGCFVITPGDGLRPPWEFVNIRKLQEYADVRIDLRNELYRLPLERDARALAGMLKQRRGICEIILLGSVATEKYTGVLQPLFPGTLLFPMQFVGRGDMSRGGLLLRCIDALRELEYIPVEGAVRHGPRPPRLEKRRRRP
jgi:hypothetical protein